jgi:hypothetical protein
MYVEVSCCLDGRRKGRKYCRDYRLESEFMGFIFLFHFILSFSSPSLQQKILSKLISTFFLLLPQHPLDAL